MEGIKTIQQHPQGVLEISGGNVPLVGNPEVNIGIPNKIKEELGLNTINDIITKDIINHPILSMLRDSFLRIFKPTKQKLQLKVALNINNKAIKEG
uniref:Uncharacterized protein n=1 Tax=Lepeophtheirus salmonis TaxID=72036 RepID=A0A0K2TK50_LEPSM